MIILSLFLYFIGLSGSSIIYILYCLCLDTECLHSPHSYYPSHGDILVGGGRQGPPAGLPGHQVTLGVRLARVDRLDLSLRQLPANITDYLPAGVKTFKPSGIRRNIDELTKNVLKL